MGSLSMMVSKALKLFLVSLSILQTNGCFTPVLKNEFIAMDQDKNGFVTEDEACQLVRQNYFGADADEFCEVVWKAFDLNEDGRAYCQETLVGAIALDVINENDKEEFAHQLRSIFADKPENCQEISKEELTSLIMIDINEGNGNEVNVEYIYQRIDVNRDGIFTCNEVLWKLFVMLQDDPDVENEVTEELDAV